MTKQPKKIICNVCDECGISANVLTCLKKYKNRPSQLKFSLSTYHQGECDFCRQKKNGITQVRDFFYPDFELLKKKIKKYDKTK